MTESFAELFEQSQQSLSKLRSGAIVLGRVVEIRSDVVVVNAAKVKLTGRKMEQKRYFAHTGYMGHERFTPAASMIAKHPERVIEKAVYGMLPKSALGRQTLRRKLRVYATANHPHVAQQPAVLKFNARTNETK